MPLLADNRIPDTTLPDNQFQDGDIFYGDDANKVSDTLKAGVNANYNDIKRLANGDLGTVIQPDDSIKYIRLNQDGVLEVSTDNQNYVTTSYAIQDEDGNIANHRPYIYFEGAYIVDNGARIEVHGFQGPQGLTGPEGQQGVQGEPGPAGTSQAVAPQSGFYTLETDPDGNLYVCYPDDEFAPTFTYEKGTGNLYVEIDGQQVLVGNIQGPQGVKGDQGVSPTVSQTQIDDGWKVTITDATGPHEFTLTNGVSTTVSISTIEGGHTVTITDKDGDHAFNVMDGATGPAGFSPTVAVGDITGGHSVTITDSTGPKTFNVMDGVKGDQGIQGNPGNDGFSPTVATANIEGGTKVTITDVSGPHEFTVLDGTKGDQGIQGNPGNDGFSPTVAVSEISGGHTVTITDASGAHPFNVIDGTDGSDGFSPTVETTPVSGGTQVTITDAEGPHTFNVENGAGIPTGGTEGQYLRKTANGTEWSDIEAVSEIDDSQPQSTTTTFSAKSISDMFEALEDNVTAGDTALETKINAKPSINDTTASATSVYSSNKTNSLLSTKADNTTVTALTNTVNTKADSATVSALDTRVDTVETTLSTKADSSTVTSLSGTVSTLQTKVNGLGYVNKSAPGPTGGDYWQLSNTTNTYSFNGDMTSDAYTIVLSFPSSTYQDADQVKALGKALPHISDVGYSDGLTTVTVTCLEAPSINIDAILTVYNTGVAQ